jgi:hypothetical protein
MKDWEQQGERLAAPAVQRNRDAILDVLRRVLPGAGTVLEVASGSGEHARYFALSLPNLVFQPSDPGADYRASIDAWGHGVPNMRRALELDASADWPATEAAAVLCINMIHIAPWEATIGLIRGAAKLGAMLITYGPYRIGDEHTSPSNAAFDADLKSRNPLWGVRDLEAVSALASNAGFLAPEVVQMPANNLMLVFRKIS